MNCFKHAFCGQMDQIASLRSNSSVFAEICADYETLMGLLPLDADDPTIHDVNDSLADLEREIRTYLGPASDLQPAALSPR